MASPLYTLSKFYNAKLLAATSCSNWIPTVYSNLRASYARHNSKTTCADERQRIDTSPNAENNSLVLRVRRGVYVMHLIATKESLQMSHLLSSGNALEFLQYLWLAACHRVGTSKTGVVTANSVQRKMFSTCRIVRISRDERGGRFHDPSFELVLEAFSSVLVTV